MSDESLSAQSCTLPGRALAWGRDLWRQISNPLALGLLGLAVAVTVWGYGYKLSLYIVPSGTSSSRIPAKLWIEHRFGFSELSSSATTPNLKARIFAQPSVWALLAAGPEFSSHNVTALLSGALRSRTIPFFHAAIPLRSPPFNVSS